VGDFFGLNLALTALYAQRRGLDTTGQNIANVNTEGYSRQRVNMTAIAGATVPAFHTRTSGMTGGGVVVSGVDRLRDQFLEARGLQEHAAQEQLTENQVVFGRLELLFAEPSDTGLGALFADFWNGWHDVANRPDDPAARTQLIERATTLATGLNNAATELETLRTDAGTQLGTVVAEANGMATSIAQLNLAIRNATTAGLSPTDLLDQRDLLVTKLSELVGVTTRVHEDQTVDVYVGAMAIVRGGDSADLTVDMLASPATLRWAAGGQKADVDSGKAGGLLDAINTVLPRYLAEIQTVTDTLRDDVNTAYKAGIVGGDDFFVNLPNGSLAVNPTIAADPSTLVTGDPGGGALDGSRASRIAALSGPDNAYRRLIVTVGVDAQTANRRVDIQQVITDQVDAARESASGVNLDEEMANMVAYQHAYNAAARFMTAIDEALNTLVNSTGIVGR
jgi:flagellar hook-associated protein 1